MNERVEQRMLTLKQEYQAGQKMLAELDLKRQPLQTTLLHSEGATEVLQELAEPPKLPAAF